MTNDDMAEDMVSVSRVAPGFVHVDPTAAPHRLGTARYIRECMWVPLKFLKDDPEIQQKKQLKATSVGSDDELAFGEVMGVQIDTEEMQTLKESVDNGEVYVVTGPVLESELPTMGPSGVSVPAYYYKVVVDLRPPGVEGIGFILPNGSANQSIVR